MGVSNSLKNNNRIFLSGNINQLIYLGNENNGYQNLNKLSILNTYVYDDKKENIEEIKKIEKKFEKFPEYN